MANFFSNHGIINLGGWNLKHTEVMPESEKESVLKIEVEANKFDSSKINCVFFMKSGESYPVQVSRDSALKPKVGDTINPQDVNIELLTLEKTGSNDIYRVNLSTK